MIMHQMGKFSTQATLNNLDLTTEFGQHGAFPALLTAVV